MSLIYKITQGIYLMLNERHSMTKGFESMSPCRLVATIHHPRVTSLLRQPVAMVFISVSRPAQLDQ
jgi:hypothetical protein